MRGMYHRLPRCGGTAGGERRSGPPGSGRVTGLPDFSGLVAENGAAVVNISVVEKAQKMGVPGEPRTMAKTRCRSSSAAIKDLPEAGRARTAQPRHRLRFHRQRRRLRVDQCARGGGCLRGDGQADRSAGVRRQGDRRRQAQRRGADQDRRHRPADRALRRFGAPQARSVGDRHRFAVRLREQRDGRRRQRHRASAR